MNTSKIGILYICTGKYSIFWKDFYLSMEKNFVVDSEKHYFVFTDNPQIDFEDTNPNIHRIYQDDLGWPGNTLLRFQVFLDHEKEFQNMDYLFFFNANLLVLKEITKEEFLPTTAENLVATLSPGFYNKKRNKFTYENNPKSTAYISNQEGLYYFAGGLNGGRTKNFIDAMRIMREEINTDTGHNITAQWHDESHWNKYLINRKDVKILPPAYLYPEGWSIPFDPIILIRDKNKFGGHNFLRKEKDTFIKTLIKKQRKFISKIIDKVRDLKNIISYHYAKSIIQTNGLYLENTPLLLITIAYNNSEIIKIQNNHLKKNLREGFVYMIADNSTLPNISRIIESYCNTEKIPYIRLPQNPHKEPSKSHGSALNWVYKNVIKKYHPVIFGFLDHDIFPYKPTSISPYIREGIFGLLQNRNEKWYLWPGFCFYNFKLLRNTKVDFMPCSGLDTGGKNYHTLYKKINKDKLSKISRVYVDIEENKIVPEVNQKNTTTTIECIGDWIHIMRASNWNPQKNNKVSSIEEIVKQVKELI